MDPAIETKSPEAPPAQPLFGLYQAEVLDATDPLNDGRLQIGIPALVWEPAWAAACKSPDPIRVGATVVVGFLRGDPKLPIVLGEI